MFDVFPVFALERYVTVPCKDAILGAGVGSGVWVRLGRGLKQVSHMLESQQCDDFGLSWLELLLVQGLTAIHYHNTNFNRCYAILRYIGFGDVQGSINTSLSDVIDQIRAGKEHLVPAVLLCTHFDIVR